MIIRNEFGAIEFAPLDFECYIGNMFYKCKDNKEIDWLVSKLMWHISDVAEIHKSGISELDKI